MKTNSRSRQLSAEEVDARTVLPTVPAAERAKVLKKALKRIKATARVDPVRSFRGRR